MQPGKYREANNIHDLAQQQRDLCPDVTILINTHNSQLPPTNKTRVITASRAITVAVAAWLGAIGIVAGKAIWRDHDERRDFPVVKDGEVTHVSLDDTEYTTLCAISTSTSVMIDNITALSHELSSAPPTETEHIANAIQLEVTALREAIAKTSKNVQQALRPPQITNTLTKLNDELSQTPLDPEPIVSTIALLSEEREPSPQEQRAISIAGERNHNSIKGWGFTFPRP